MKLKSKHWIVLLVGFILLLPLSYLIPAEAEFAQEFPKVIPADTRAGQDVFCYSIGQLGYDYVTNYRLGMEKKANEVGGSSNWVLMGWTIYALKLAYTGRYTPDSLRQDLMMECLVTVPYS